MYKKKAYKKTYKKKHVNKEVMVNPQIKTFSKDHMVVAPIYRTKMGTMLAGYSAGALTQNGQFFVSGNSIRLPFYSTQATPKYISGQIGGGFYSAANATTINPEGFSNICGATSLYAAYRVISSKINISWTPQGSGDPCYLVVGAFPNGTTPNSVLFTQAESPFASKIILGSSLFVQKSITKKLMTHKVYGVHPKEVTEDFAFSSYYNNSPAKEWCWNIIWQTLDGTATAEPIGFVIKIEYEVEFFAPNTGGLSEL